MQENKTAHFTENICPTVVVKVLYYLLERGVIDQHRNIHIDDTWLQKIHISNSENRIYLHNAHRLEDSKMKQICNKHRSRC